MGKKKQTTNQKSTNTYGYQTPPDTKDISTYRDSVNSAYDTADPSIAYSFGGARNRINDRFDNPFGANYSPEVADAYKYSGMNDLDAAQGQAYKEDSYNRKNAKVSAQAGLAGLTAPQLTQTGGTLNGTTTQSQPIWGQLLGAGASIGSAALM